MERLGPGWSLALVIFAIHAIIRFGGLRNAMFFPLSMAIIWPLPWLLSPKAGRHALGITAPESWRWLWLGPLIAVGMLALCVASTWLVFGSGEANWFTRHALALREATAGSARGLDRDALALALGWIVNRSGSLWPAVIAHRAFNLGMNAVAFLLLPDLVGL